MNTGKNMIKYIDLTHPLTRNTPIYPGANEQPPIIREIMFVDRDGYAQSELIMSLHVGTHMDAPAHMVSGGKKLNDYSVDRFCGLATIFDVREMKLITRGVLSACPKTFHPIVLFCSSYDRYFFSNAEQYFKTHPTMTEDAVQLLIENGVKMVGFDMPSPDCFPFVMHKMFFARDIVIIENLTNLESLLDCQQVEIFALPLFCESDGAPARVIAKTYT